MRLARALIAATLAFVATNALATSLPLIVQTAEVGASHGAPGSVLKLTLAPESAKAFGDLTAANIGKVVELRINGRVVMTPVVRDPIRGGAVEISGNFEPGELQTIATQIAGGAAKVEVEVKAAE